MCVRRVWIWERMLTVAGGMGSREVFVEMDLERGVGFQKAKAGEPSRQTALHQQRRGKHCGLDI